MSSDPAEAASLAALSEGSVGRALGLTDASLQEFRRGLIDELASDGGHPDLLVAADYDPGLRYLCLTAFDTRTAP